MIHIADSQTDRILDFIQEEEFWDDKHYKSLKDTLETFDFVTFADREFSEHLAKRNRIIIPDEDGKFIEFIIQNTMKYRGQQGGLFVEVYTSASYIELKKSKVIKPQKLEGYTAAQHADFALAGTEWEVGRVDYAGIRTITIESHTNPYAYLKRIASEFGLELRFRVEVDGNKVTHRYVDLIEHVGGWQGREVEFGKDLLGIERKEDMSNVVTALIGLGPEREDGTRLEVLVEDKDALARWGRNGQHLIETYEPESTDQTMTEERLRELTKNELEKRINSIVEYTADIADLEKVPGLEHEKIRFGDVIRIKDTDFNPPLYLEAQIHTQDRSIKREGRKTVTLGDYIEYTEEEVMAIWKALQAQIQERLARLVTVSISASAGTVFKNGEGSTILRAVTYRTGQEIDLDGQMYTYEWQKYDKDGNLSGTATGKQISVQASEINEKATFNVTIKDNGNALSSATVTVTNVYDGEDGEQGPPGPKGEDGKTFYTWIKYADTPTSGMSDSPDGKEYIGIAYNKETPTPSTNYADYTWSKFKGDQGIQGPKGADGQTTYTWVKYADDEHGNGMSDSPDGKLYIGLAFNKTTPQESNNPADYTWSLMPQNIEIGGRNLFALSTSERGYLLSDGTVSTSHPRNELTSNYIDVSHIDEVVISYYFSPTPEHKWIGWVFYDESKTPITSRSSYHLQGTENSTETWTRVLNVPNNAKYIRVSARWLIDQQCLLKLEKGNRATDWTRADEDVQEQIDEAKQEAEEAKQEAQNAMSTADGKNTVFRQSSQPPTAGRKNGDLWFKTDAGNKMYVFAGSVWVETKLDAEALAVGKLSAISADLGNITAGHIQGVTLDLANGKFVVDVEGNVKFAGTLDGASGTFGEVTVKDGDFYLEDNQSLTKYSVVSRQNFFNDHSFETISADDPQSQDDIDKNWSNAVIPEVGSPWVAVGTPRCVPNGFHGPPPYEASPIFGNRSIAVNNANYVQQDVYNISPGATYTVSWFAKRVYNTPAGTGQVVIQHIRTQPDGTETVVSEKISATMVVRNDYKPIRVSASFVHGNIQSNDFLRFKFRSTNSNWVMIDGVQLVEGNYPTVYEPEGSFWNFIQGMTPAILARMIEADVDLLNIHQRALLHGDAVLTTADRNWIAPTLLNGVSNYGGSYERAGYYKDAQGFVHLRGFLTGSGDGKHLFTLPSGYRPSRERSFATYSNSSSGSSRVQVYPDGRVLAVISGNWLFLDGILFDT